MIFIVILLARLTLILHFLFIGFVVFGGLLISRYKDVIWLHLPAVVWAIGISVFGWQCPLTPLEKWFLELADYPAYTGSFIEEYLLTSIYHGSLTRLHQYLIASGVLMINTYFYGSLIYRS